MKFYIGRRTTYEAGVYVCLETGQTLPLDPRLDLWNHSPDGLEWGYNGSGPAQTALAVLADALEHDGLAVRLYQQFKREVVGQLPGMGWVMTNEYICRWALDTCASVMDDVSSPEETANVGE